MVRIATAALFSLVAFATTSITPAFAQWCDLSGRPITSLRDPLIYGATSSAPLQVAPEGQPPPVGDGFLSPPTTPGMDGPPTLIPSVPTTPANDIENPSTRIYTDPRMQSFPGELGASTWAPPPASTPGEDPGIIHTPQDWYPPPANLVDINPSGGIEGSASEQRWGGQTSQDFGRYKSRGKRTYEEAQELAGQSSEDGLNHARNGAQPTQDLYGNRLPIRDNGKRIVQTIVPY
jgi:hypothetical protein